MTRRIAGGLVVLGFLLTAVAWVTGGWSVAVLVSPSMEPYAAPGDLLVHHQVPAEDITVGDVVTVPARGDRLGTHRVVRLVRTDDGMVMARLKGDASPLPNPVPVLLQGEVARVVAVVPRLGSVLNASAPLLWSGLGLLVLGGGVLVVARRHSSQSPAATDTTAPPVGDTGGAAATPGPAGEGTPPLADPRLEALLATCEQFAEDGMPVVVVRDLVRVRTAVLLGLPSAERAGAVLALDDGARFYVMGLADADPDALALIPPGSERRLHASGALDQWWAVVRRDLPAAVAAQLAPWLQPPAP